MKNPKNRTGLLIIDPYNDFMTEGGKFFKLTQESRDKFKSFENMVKVIEKFRADGIQVFIVPHHRSTPGDKDKWSFPNPDQQKVSAAQGFAKGTWGGEFNPTYGPREGDVIIHEHFAQSGFANTDLDMQLKQHGITHIILIGMIANTCVESTARQGMELGYHVTLVSDATAAFSLEGMKVAHEINGPTYAHSILTTEELINS